MNPTDARRLKLLKSGLALKAIPLGIEGFSISVIGSGIEMRLQPGIRNGAESSP
jgi:hypothetical protein